MNLKKEKIKQIEMKARTSKKSWPIVKLGEMATLMTGGTPSTSKKEYYGGKIRWLVSSDIHKKEIFNCNGRITELGLKNSNAKILPTNSVLIALNGQGKTRGTVAMLKVAATCNQSLVSIKPNKKKLLSEFLMYILESKYEEIRRFSGGKDRGGLNMPTIRAIAIPLPPLEEQRKIAAVLSQIQKNINIKDQLIKTTKELKKSVMKHLFTYGIKGEKTKHNWPKVELGRVCEIISGQSPEGRYYNSNGQGMPFYQGKTEFREKYIVEPRKWTTRITKIAKRNDILMSVRAPVGPVNISLFEICIGRGLAAIRGNPSEINQEYLFYLLQEKQKKISGNIGSIFASINKNDIQKIKIPVPSLDEQKKIAGILQKIDERIKNYEEQKASLQDLFKSMLHKLMMAQICLDNINIDINLLKERYSNDSKNT